MTTAMDANELVERYVAAVAKRLPTEQRRDVSQELESLIRDTLEERSEEAGREITVGAAAIILREFGPPEEMARKYSSRPNYLIGPQVYPAFVITLKAVLAGALGLAALVTATSAIFGDPVGPLEPAGLFLRLFFNFATSFLFVAVVVFAVLERVVPDEVSQVIKGEWDPLALPAPARESEELSIFEVYFNTYAVVILLLWFNLFPDWVGILFRFSDKGAEFVTLSELGIRLPLIWMNLWWAGALVKNALLLKQERWTRRTRWLEFCLGLLGAGILILIDWQNLPVFASESFRESVRLPVLADILGRGIPVALAVVAAVLLFVSAQRAWRLLRSEENPL